jgi:hypothetical protein
MNRMHRWPGGLAVLAAVAAAGLAGAGLAACGGSASSAPQVASLSKTRDPSGATSAPGSAAVGGPAHPKGNPTELLDQWAACMRRHGDPGQADPTIDTDKVIHITVPVSRPGNNAEEVSSQAHGSTGPCARYELAAQKALRGGQPAPKGPTMAQQLSYARCMRAHGVPKFPDPNGSNSTYVGNLDPNGPVFLDADKVCSAQNGMSSSSAPEPPGTVQVQSARLPVPGQSERTVSPGANG